jgi:hypothetical protein
VAETRFPALDDHLEETYCKVHEDGLKTQLIEVLVEQEQRCSRLM